MFYALPASTVFEAKEKNRRATFWLLGSLIFLYVFFFDLMVSAVSFWFSGAARFPAGVSAGLLAWSTGTAVLLALAHFAIARARSLDSLLAQIEARPADPADSLHAQFIHVVEEAQAAIGAPAIRPVVLSSPGLNAFSMEDGRGQKAIGITEGLLAKLNRQELSAVVAHEAAHLLHEDSRLVTTACFLFGVFGTFQAFLGRALNMGAVGRGRRQGGGLFALLVLWLIAGAGYLVTKLLFMAVSREREFLADADGVQMCKDPLALAESLYKISNRYRGGLPATFSALFIANPQDSPLDEGEGWFADLFSTHPSMGKRLAKLLAWAKADLAQLRALDAQEEKTAVPAGSAGPDQAQTPPAFMAYQNGQWTGPYPPGQMASLGLLSPDTWVCPAGSQEVVRVSQNPVLLPFLQAAAGSVPGAKVCPRCKLPLTETNYEGAEILTCGFCKGSLLGGGVLERIISRQSLSFGEADLQKAKAWRNAQRGTIAERDHFPSIQCPLCQSHMGKFIHSYLTQVVLDRCVSEACGAVWLDGGELDTIQMLLQEARQEGA